MTELQIEQIKTQFETLRDNDLSMQSAIKKLLQLAIESGQAEQAKEIMTEMMESMK